MMRGSGIEDTHAYSLQEVFMTAKSDDRFTATIIAADKSARIIQIGLIETRRVLDVVPPTWPMYMFMVRVWRSTPGGEAKWEPLSGIMKIKEIWEAKWYRNTPYIGITYLDY